MIIRSHFSGLSQCRYGLMAYNLNDIYVGQSLALYGEFSEGEQEVFRSLVRPEHTVLEVGANIGAHTVGLARMAKAVVAIEPQRIPFYFLCANVVLNSLVNVRCLDCALGMTPGLIELEPLDPRVVNNFGGLELGHGPATVPMRTIDSLGLPALDFLKVDVEGMEADVLDGGAETIKKHRPIIYVENDRPDKSERLLQILSVLDYDWQEHAPPLYNPANYHGNSRNIFEGIVSLNLICRPRAE